ncbi:MAG TPA: hypothetical protein VLE73_05660 [Candidatus Saccharimonadales bacterium]|nr:hypothetical protein [Candidatus Saccharimonadales bacterium]
MSNGRRGAHEHGGAAWVGRMKPLQGAPTHKTFGTLTIPEDTVRSDFDYGWFGRAITSESSAQLDKAVRDSLGEYGAAYEPYGGAVGIAYFGPKVLALIAKNRPSSQGADLVEHIEEWAASRTTLPFGEKQTTKVSGLSLLKGLVTVQLVQHPPSGAAGGIAREKHSLRQEFDNRYSERRAPMDTQAYIVRLGKLASADNATAEATRAQLAQAVVPATIDLRSFRYHADAR